ncbi:hypothetical protein [Phenylobacterium sp.]|uniref:hypothetical protein n=1 Tax=Phenylobacterium sp. TaxID=1871053 RepID=UPI0035AE35F4
MIHVVNPDNRELYAREFERLYELAGDDAARRAALEGGPGVVHLLALDDDGALEFACRLRSSSVGSTLAERAPWLVAGGVEAVVSPEVWERTSIYAKPGLCAPDLRMLERRGELRLAALEEVRDQGAERIVEIVPSASLVTTLRSGWRVRLLGLPGVLDGAPVVAVEVDASPAAAADLRERLAGAAGGRLRLSAAAAPSVAPREIEAFLKAAQQIDPDNLQPLLIALRAAVADDADG